MVYGHIASIILFAALGILFYYINLTIPMVIMLVCFVLSGYKGVKLYKMHKSGAFKAFTESYRLKDFVGGNKDEIKGKYGKESYGDGFKRDGETVYGSNQQAERSGGKPERTGKSISFDLLINGKGSRKTRSRDTDTFDPDGD